MSDALRERLAQLSPERRALLEQKLGVDLGRTASATIPRRPTSSGWAPLSYSQELLWRLAQSMPDLVAYNVPRVLKIRGALNVDTLRGALDGIVARHEVLRTRFIDTNEGLRQVVDLPATAPFEFVDRCNVPLEAAEAEVDQVLVDRARFHFDLTRDTQLRATLIRVSDTQHILLLLSHHIVSDEWSRDLLFRELAALYTAHAAKEPDGLPDLAIQYSDYAAWQREAIERGSLGEHMAFWRSYLRGLPPLEMPTDYARGPVPTFRGERRRYSISASTLQALRELSRANDATLFMTLMAAYQLLLFRYSGQDDFAVGTPITTRRQLELEGLIGYFPNVLVLRAPLAGDPTFVELVLRVRRACLDAYEHQDVPLEKLAMETRDGVYTPLFQTWFVLLTGDTGTIRLGDTVAEPVPLDFRTAKFDVAVVAAEHADELHVTVEYRTDLYEATTIDRFFATFQSILEHVSRTPTTAISSVPLMTAGEREEVLAVSGGDATDYPANDTLVDLLEAQARRTPASLAVEDEFGRLTFAELHARANALAACLAGRGVGPGSLVGVCMERSTDLVVALLAVLKSGAAYVPVDPEYPADRIAFMLADANAAVVLTQSGLVGLLPSHAGLTLPIDELAFEDLASLARPLTGPAAHDAAYMIYTSGSTGLPKGTLNSHRAIVNRLRWMQDEYKLTGNDVVLQKTPASFDVSVWEFFWPLISGARLVMARPGGHRETTYLADLIAERQISVLHFVPSMLAAFLEEPDLAQRCASLRDVMCSGEALSSELARRFFAAIPTARLHNLYGPTEAAVDVSYFKCRRDEPHAIVPIGRPVANTQLYVLDPRRQLVPVGVPGELYIAGAQVGIGYHNRPELTADRFVPDSIAAVAGGSTYRTGDRARWLPDGLLEFMGRMDLQVKLRGQRVELGEIESALAEHPSVHQAVAMVHHDDEGEQRLVAYVVPRAEESDGADDGAREKWAAIFDETYLAAEGTHATSEPAFNIAGWISSFDQRPIPAGEMREWVDGTCEQIIALRPKHVLEIGCGTGLILFRVAPHCETYLGVDISAAGLRAIEADPSTQGLPGVRLRKAEAHDLGDLPAGSFDAIVLNSVVQYFPSVEYLLDVLDICVRLLAPGGALFLGDIRSLPQLEAFHVSVALANASGETPLAEVRGRVEQALAQESELIIDPAFFDAVRTRLPRISTCVMRLKSGRGRNELVRFRYDALLRAEADPESAPVVVSGDGVRALARITDALASTPVSARINDLPNVRVSRDLRAVELLYSTTGVVRQLNVALDGDDLASGVDPADLAGLDPAYSVELLTASSGAPDRFDAVFRRKEVTVMPVAAAQPAALAAQRPWRDFVHHPANTTFDAAQVQVWRAHLSRKLPDFMIPSMFVRLDHLPLTPSGKADRRALHPPTFTRVSRNVVAPRTDMERAIAAIWAEVLRVAVVGVEDSFLDLGGHSLLAMRIIARMRRDYGVALPLADLLRGATVAEVACSIQHRDTTGEAILEDEPELAPVARGAHRRATNVRDPR